VLARSDTPGRTAAQVDFTPRKSKLICQLEIKHTLVRPSQGGIFTSSHFLSSAPFRFPALDLHVRTRPAVSFFFSSDDPDARLAIFRSPAVGMPPFISKDTGDREETQLEISLFLLGCRQKVELSG